MRLIDDRWPGSNRTKPAVHLLGAVPGARMPGKYDLNVISEPEREAQREDASAMPAAAHRHRVAKLLYGIELPQLSRTCGTLNWRTELPVCRQGCLRSALRCKRT